MIDENILKERIQNIREPEHERLKITGGAIADGYVTACDDILNIIKSIESSQTKIIKEAESLLPEPYGFLQTDIHGGSESVYSKEQMLAILKAGIEWQKSQDESRRRTNIKIANTDVPVDSDLETAFNDIWRDCEVRIERNGSLDEQTTEAMKALCHDFFESGKEWYKSHISEQAIEGVIGWYYGLYLNYKKEQLLKVIENSGIKVDDKVKIIVIKEEKR